MATRTQDVVAGIDMAMKQLRDSMKGIQIRTAGFKADHDNVARAAGHFTVTLIEAEALLHIAKRRKSRRR